MTSRERFLATCAHQKTDRPCVDVILRTDYMQELVRFLGAKDVEETFRILGGDLRKFGVAEYNPKFEAKTTGILPGNSQSSGKRFIIRGNEFEDMWGVVQRLGDDMLYEGHITGPFVNDPDLDKFDWPDFSTLEAQESVNEKVAKASQGSEYATFGELRNPFRGAWAMRGMDNLDRKSVV